MRHRVVGLPDPLPMRRLPDTDLWAATTVLPERVAGGVPDRDRDAASTTSASTTRSTRGSRTRRWGRARCAPRPGTRVPDWVHHDPEARPGELVEDVLRSKALRREQAVKLYLPARYNTALRYPLLVVHDGNDYLQYAAMKTVLDNLIHRLDVAPLVVAFVPPRDRLKEYPNHAPHARFIARELVPRLAERLSLLDDPQGRALMGSSFGGHRVPVDGGAVPGRVRLAVAAVRVDGLHRHRQRPRRRARLRPGREVRQPLPREADPPGRADLHVAAAPTSRSSRPNRSMVPVFRERRHDGEATSRPATGTTGRTGATGCATACPGSFPDPQKFVYE